MINVNKHSRSYVHKEIDEIHWDKGLWPVSVSDKIAAFMNYDVKSTVSPPVPKVRTLASMEKYKVSTDAPILYSVCK